MPVKVWPSVNLEFTKDPIVKDISYGWNLNVGYSEKGIAEITILDAQRAGYWPLENADALLPFMTQQTQPSRAMRT